jgi:hypothetical protein
LPNKKIRLIGKIVESSFVDPDSLNLDPDTDPDPAFQVNPDLIRIRIQGLITKIWKKIQWK